MTTQEQWLAGLSEERLTRVLDARSDVATDLPPRTFAALSQLLETPRSVTRAVLELDASALAVLAAMKDNDTRAALAVRLDEGGVNTAADIDRALDELAGRGLAWPSGDGYRSSALHGQVVDIDGVPNLARPWPGVSTETGVGAQQLAVARFCETADAVLDAVDQGSISTLKPGGVGAREIRSLTKSVGAEHSSVVELVLELTRALGLLDSRGGVLRGTTDLPAFMNSARAVKLGAFIAAWWCAEGSLTNRPPSNGKATAVLRFPLHSAYYPTFRKNFLASIPESGVADDARAVEYLEWALPRFSSISEPGDILALWREATWLGVVAGNVPTDLARALVHSGVAAHADTMAAIGPIAEELVRSSSCTVHLLPDLTAVVSGPVSERVWSVLVASADAETKDAASTWRFTPTSIRRFLDDGGTADQLVEDLTEIADTDVPQNLHYLIEDCGRRHGHVSVHSAATIVVSDDEVLVREVATIGALKARLVAPTVLASSVGPKRVLELLRSAGYSPRDDGHHGQVEVTRAKARGTNEVGLQRYRPGTPAAVLARALASGNPVPMDNRVVTEKIEAWCRLPVRDVAELVVAVTEGRTVHIHRLNNKRGSALDEMNDLVLHADAVHGWSVQAHGRTTVKLSTIRMVRLV